MANTIFKELFKKITGVDDLLDIIIPKFKEATTELKKMDTLLVNISKSNKSLSSSELTKIANDSFSVASKYGKQVSDYLSIVQEMTRAGYQNSKALAELSITAQSATDMTSDLANQYILATDKAYKLNGDVQELTKTLDGANNITTKNAVNMSSLAEGMTIIGSTAASSKMQINETTAALATMLATTKLSGSEAANALQDILNAMNSDSIGGYQNACEKLGVSLYEVKNGATSIKEPMQILKELSIEVSKLGSSDIKRSNLLGSVGDANTSSALSAILDNYSLYEKMLADYAAGTGTLAMDAEKAATSWEGSLNRLSNTWTDTVGNIANSDAVIGITDSLNGLLSIVNKVTDVLGPAGSLGVGLGALLGVKDVGRDKRLSLT